MSWELFNLFQISNTSFLYVLETVSEKGASIHGPVMVGMFTLIKK